MKLLEYSIEDLPSCFLSRQKIKKCYQRRNKSRDDYPYEDESIPLWVAPIVLGVAIGLFYAMYANYQALPKPLMRDNQVVTNSLLFLYLT